MEIFPIINKKTCVSCSSCKGITPDIFEHDNKGLSQVIINENQGSVEVPEGLEEE